MSAATKWARTELEWEVSNPWQGLDHHSDEMLGRLRSQAVLAGGNQGWKPWLRSVRERTAGNMIKAPGSPGASASRAAAAAG